MRVEGCTKLEILFELLVQLFPKMASEPWISDGNNDFWETMMFELYDRCRVGRISPLKPHLYIEQSKSSLRDDLQIWRLQFSR